MIHERWVSVRVMRKCPAMDTLAQQLESEFEELGLALRIRVVQEG